MVDSVGEQLPSGHSSDVMLITCTQLDASATVLRMSQDVKLQSGF